jgi:hypothetical protein
MQKNNVFISYAEEDSNLVLEISKALETAGFNTWYYERDSIPGHSYLLQTSEAIERAEAVILIISLHSIRSYQVTKEIVAAFEAEKVFIPILYGITHTEFQQLQPEWRRAIGSAVSISVPPEGIASIMPRILKGLTQIHTKKESAFFFGHKKGHPPTLKQPMLIHCICGHDNALSSKYCENCGAELFQKDTEIY